MATLKRGHFFARQFIDNGATIELDQ